MTDNYDGNRMIIKNKVERKKPPVLVFNDAQLIFRNFSGRQGEQSARFHIVSKPGFNVMLDPDTAKALVEKGFNVRYLGKDTEDEQAHINIKINMNANRPPVITVHSGHGETLVNHDNYDQWAPALDWCTIDKADITANPYHWRMNQGKGNESGGWTLYLTKMDVYVPEDPIETKFAGDPDVPDSGQNTIEFKQVSKK